MSQDDLRVFEKIATDIGYKELCRTKAILLLGKFGDHHIRQDLASMYARESHNAIKRAIIFACQELAHGERNTFYNMVKSDSEMKHTVLYIEKLRSPKYYGEEDWTPLDLPDWGTY